MNAHQRRLVRRAASRELARHAAAYDAEPSTLPWDYVRRLGWPRRARSASERAAQRRVHVVLDDWIEWSQYVMTVAESLRAGKFEMLTGVFPLTTYRRGMETQFPPFCLLGQGEQVVVRVRTLGEQCGPATIAMDVVLAPKGAWGPDSTYRVGARLDRLDPGDTAELSTGALPEDARFVGLALDWAPVEPWDRRLSRFLALEKRA